MKRYVYKLEPMLKKLDDEREFDREFGNIIITQKMNATKL